MRCGPTITNQKNEKNRVDEVDDVVSTTGAVCLGLTVGCARCHDHKYEPISQRDYYRLFAVFDNTAKFDDAEMMQVRDPGSQAHKTYIMLGGDCTKRGDEVPPGVPEVLDDGKAVFPTAAGELAGSVGRRLALAKWIADADNPLTARVIVNRLWLYHFGRGLVNTPSNFGTSGDPPTHPELIDYLAGELVHGGWKLKRIQKMIVMSATYRQASSPEPEKAGLDPSDQWYWRYPLRRLEAEEIRDSILAASGNLNPQMFGPGTHPRMPDHIIAAGSKDKWPIVKQEGPEEWRRSVYVFIKRSTLLPMLESFDAPNATQSCERRTTTTVATQALQLLNDEFTNEQAEDMAARVIRETGDGVTRQVERSVLARPFAPADRRRAPHGRRIRRRTLRQRAQATARQAHQPDDQSRGAPPPRSGRFVPRDF